MTGRIPHNALVVVADGTGARFFRNVGRESKISLSAEGEFKPTDTGQPMDRLVLPGSDSVGPQFVFPLAR